MKCACKTGKFLAFVVLLTAGPAFSQIPTPDASPESSSSAPVAHVFVQTHQGVDVFDSSSSGKLTLVKGSPFATTGQMGGATASHLISMGTDDVHVYAVGSTGAVGEQQGEVNTQSYGGAQCGNTTGLSTFLDHTGKYYYLQLSGIFDSGSVACVAWQSYELKSNGTLDFLGSMEYSGYGGHDASPSSLPTVSSNDKFAYGIFDQYSGFFYTTFSTLKRASSGDLETISNFKETDPQADQNVPNGPWSFFPVAVQADPSSHLAVLLQNQSFAGCCGYFGPMQLASYSINSSTGSVSSTNKYEDMPTPSITVTGSLGEMEMSPSGKLLALAGTGLEIFHFNGASPITEFGSALLPGISINQLAWDNNNHLYALSYGTNKLYVYTVTTTSIKEVAGSPFTVNNAYGVSGLIVVPK
jgi:hypothetical protein